MMARRLETSLVVRWSLSIDVLRLSIFFKSACFSCKRSKFKNKFKDSCKRRGVPAGPYCRDVKILHADLDSGWALTGLRSDVPVAEWLGLGMNKRGATSQLVRRRLHASQ